MSVKVNMIGNIAGAPLFPLLPKTIAYYSATLTQTSGAPVATEMFNSFGPITWTKISTGVYHATNALFTIGAPIIVMIGQNGSFILARYDNTNTVVIQTYDAGASPNDGWLTDTPITIQLFQK